MGKLLINLYETNAIRALESKVIDSKEDSSPALMQRAGLAAFELLQEKWPTAQKIAVCCGKGNNGGDGYVVARLAKQAGLDVSLYVIEPPGSDTAKQVASAAEEAGLVPAEFENRGILAADVIVDALLGSGLKGDVNPTYESVIMAINAAKTPVLAIDIPSGLDGDTGSVQGCAVQADYTITFIALKQGLFTHKGPAYCGQVSVNNLGIPTDYLDQAPATAKLLSNAFLTELLPRRNRDSHKGLYGHTLVIGGDYGMGGAVRMAAEAAMRVGSGLVSVATRPEHVSVVSGSRPEIMCHQMSQPEDLDFLLDRASVVVIGPGLGKTDWAKGLLERVLSTSDLPKIIDADGLNLLSAAPEHADNWILTPHPGEAARLLGVTCQSIQDDRFASAHALQNKYGGTVVLKGAGTVVQSNNTLPRICPAGNPGMASGGMGDILSGIIGGLLAQGLNLAAAAEAGVLVHSMAADEAARQGGERGLLATDLLAHLRNLVNPQ